MSARCLSLFAVALAFAAGCFNPKFKEDLSCGAGGECPPGQTCGADLKCHGAGGVIADAATDAPQETGADATPDAPVDAAPDAAPDAMPVGCQSNADCATPPDKCSTAGTCNLTTHVCTFPAVTCHNLDSDCAIGVCTPATGACAAMPRNENNSCGAGTTCGVPTACAFSDVCAEIGSQTRSCTDHTCHTGTCVASSRNETDMCQRSSTDGVACGSATPISCGACDYTDICDESASQSCTCSEPVCSGGTCSTTANVGCTESCSRNTNGLGCGNGHVCDAGDCICPTC